MAAAGFFGRKGNASPSSSVICEEVFDEMCQPSADEISDYAQLLGIDLVKESNLLYLAKEGLMQALPKDWKICYSEEKSGHYYYNTKTKVSQWDHPLDAVYRDLVDQARQKSATVATPIIDNSDDVSQIDSGIRSMQGNDDCDNTNNTNEMSSPVSNINAHSKFAINNAVGGSSSGGSGSNSSAINSSSTSTSGFSGGVSRFLESRSKNFCMAGSATFQAIKNSRFEVSKTSPLIGSALKFNSESTVMPVSATKKPQLMSSRPEMDLGEKRGFTLSGTGSMFLKSRKQMEAGLCQATSMVVGTDVSSYAMDSSVQPPLSVKGILRDSSLTDMRRRMAKEDNDSGNTTEDKKSVRFNLDDSKSRGSPEEDPSSSRRLTQSPEISINSDDENDDDPWDDEDDDCANMRGLCPDGSFQISLNPFLVNDEKHVKEIKDPAVPKCDTIQMLKAQSFSMDLPEREKVKLDEVGRSQSVETSAITGIAASYIDKLKDSSLVKPLYDDTDSESKGSSVRSFIINKSEQETIQNTMHSNNPFDLDELDRKHTRDVENLESKIQSSIGEKTSLRSLKVASKLVGFLKKDTISTERASSSSVPVDKEKEKDAEIPRQKERKEKIDFVKCERERLEEQLQCETAAIKLEHEQKLKNIRHEYELRLTSKQHELDEDFELQIEEYRAQLEETFDTKRKAIVDEHKAQMKTLQQNHTEILQDLERDLKSEEEIVKKEHATKLSEVRDKMNHELEVERQRMRDTGEDRLYEKVRCEKRLLEDKYRCLKEKYVRLKTDVKLSLERRNRRREAQALQQHSLHTTNTTGSETERSISNKPSIGNSEIRSLSLSTSNKQKSVSAVSGNGTLVAGPKGEKPPVPPKLHLTAVSIKEPKHGRERSVEHGNSAARKPAISSKYIKNVQIQDDTTSVSQSDTNISNNYTKGRYLPIGPSISDNGNSDSEAFQNNHENNNYSRTTIQRKKLFSRMKSASTSRLNSDNYKTGDRPCTPLENLRLQLQKLEDLEDQFPDNTLDATYHLRYPFSDISNEHGAGTSSELEFFKHRIHLERDSVRRAKESLRTQRTTFRARQREIKLHHKSSIIPRHSLDQLIQEQKELTEMEVNLHRTRALLGEKVIRLRHLEQSVSRIYEKEKPSMELLGVEQKDDATLSDLSSHSSSGFSSTDFASGPETQNTHRRKDNYHQESSECIQNLEILNVEIREILDILAKSQQHGGISVPMISPSDLAWTHMLSGNPSHTAASHFHHLQQSNIVGNAAHMHALQSIPTLADRLETYRQVATGRMQTSMGGAILAANTIVSQSPRAVNYTTSLVERTRDLRNWLRHAKNEHDILTGISPIERENLAGGCSVSGTVMTGAGVGVGRLSGDSAAGSGTQTNL